MHSHLHEATETTENQGNTIPPKKLPIPDHKAMEIHELPNKESKTIGLKMLRELQEIRDKEFNKIKKAIQKQNEKFNKEIEKKT